MTDNSTIEVWPENWLPFQVFSGSATQWRVGAGGATGLDYLAVDWVMGMLKVPEEDRLDVFQAVRILESEALRQMNKKN